MCIPLGCACDPSPPRQSSSIKLPFARSASFITPQTGTCIHHGGHRSIVVQYSDCSSNGVIHGCDGVTASGSRSRRLYCCFHVKSVIGRFDVRFHAKRKTSSSWISSDMFLFSLATFGILTKSPCNQSASNVHQSSAGRCVPTQDQMFHRYCSMRASKLPMSPSRFCSSHSHTLESESIQSPTSVPKTHSACSTGNFFGLHVFLFRASPLSSPPPIRETGRCGRPCHISRSGYLGHQTLL